MADAEITKPENTKPKEQRGGGFRRGRRQGGPSEPKEFDQMIVDLSRVTRVTKGGKQMSFRATVVIGDRKGRVGFGVEKGKDVQIAVDKAVRAGKKTLLAVHLNDNKSIAHMTDAKFSASEVMIKPAPIGTGLKCGGAVRIVLDFAGVENASSKIMGSRNKINVIKATFEALKKVRAK